MFGGFFLLNKQTNKNHKNKPKTPNQNQKSTTKASSLYPISDFFANVVELYNSQKASRQSCWMELLCYFWASPCESAGNRGALAGQQAGPWTSLCCLCVEQEHFLSAWTWLESPSASGGRCRWQSLAPLVAAGPEPVCVRAGSSCRNAAACCSLRFAHWVWPTGLSLLL